MSDRSEPQPDFAILKPHPNFCLEAHPAPADVLALVEMSDSTVEFDRDTKASLYAQHGVQEIWILDLKALAVEVPRSPIPQGYQGMQSLRPRNFCLPGMQFTQSTTL